MISFVSLIVAAACAPEPDASDDADHLRVIDGLPATDATPQYAATVALHQRFGTQASTSPFCSGTLISPSAVMTAAHCCDEAKGGFKVNPFEPEDVAVYFGEGPAMVDGELSGELVAVSEVSIHPNYNSFELVNDICLLRLAEPRQNTPTVPHLPAALGLSDADAGVLLDHVGYGYSDLDKTQFGVRLHTQIPFAGLGCVVDGCPNAATDGQFSFVQDSDPYSGTCNGDSGGPAFIDRGGKIYVAGITSYGDAACNLYGVSTNVSAYQPFIDAFIGASLGGPTCGDGVCGFGESCDGRNGSSKCTADCPGSSKGRPSQRFCYVAGACEGGGC